MQSSTGTLVGDPCVQLVLMLHEVQRSPCTGAVSKSGARTLVVVLYVKTKSRWYENALGTPRNSGTLPIAMLSGLVMRE
jgi:hypothetical protein